MTGTVKTFCPEGQSPRRLPQAIYDINYNSANLKAMGAQSLEASTPEKEKTKKDYLSKHPDTLTKKSHDIKGIQA